MADQKQGFFNVTGNRNRLRRFFLIGAAVIGAVIITWLVAAIPRAIKIQRSNARLLKQPISVPTPPDTIALHVTRPDTAGIAWTELAPRLDAGGIFTVDYNARGQRGVSGVRRNPYSIATNGIYHARRFVDNGDEQSLLLALRQFDFLAGAAIPALVGEDSTLLWCADFDLGYQYQARAPWPSSYFQVYCMEAMLWAQWLTGENRYGDIAAEGLKALAQPVSAGGLAYETESGGLFFQEVVTAPLHHILNGNLTTLLVLHDYAEYTGSQLARETFERGVRGTLEMLPRFDWRGYSLYSLSPNPGLANHFNIANSTYHHLHITQLRALESITGRKEFADMADKWEATSGGPFYMMWTLLFVMFKDMVRFTTLF